MPKFKVMLAASLPCTAFLICEAENAEEAEQYAYGNWTEANWSGSDIGNFPEKYSVEMISVYKIK